jgi:internalin A
MKETGKRKLLSPLHLCLALIICLAGIVVLLIFFPYKIGKQNAATSISEVKATGKISLSDSAAVEYLLQDDECKDKLTEVDFMGDFISDISDKRFNSLKHFPHLKIIQLAYLGPVDVFLDGIQGMESLEEVTFHRSGVSEKGMGCIIGFPNIKRLSFDDHTDFALLDALKNHTGIESLWLSDYKVANSRLAFLRTLPNLRKLGLTLELTDELDLHGLPKLENLYLGDSLATDKTLANLEEMKDLAILDCEGHNITDSGIEHLRDKSKLKRLNLIFQPISDAGLEHLSVLTNLVYLNLCNTKITDAGLEHLKKLKALRKLDIQYTNVTDQGLKDLQQALPDCKIER